MPTVPNWIGHSIVILPSGSLIRPDEAIPVKSWRATRTQVIVTLDNPRRTEVRFHLDGMVGVAGDRGADLLDAEAETTKRRVEVIRYREAFADFRTTVNLTRLDGDRDYEDAAARITAIRDAATKALGALAPLL